MEKWRLELARKFMGSLKESWRKNNSDVDKTLQFIKDNYDSKGPRPDHLAIRSVSGIGFGQEEAYRLFSALGYRYGGSWWIPKLNIAACHFEPPSTSSGQVPLEKIFFSVVLLEEFRSKLSKKEYQKLKSIFGYRRSASRLISAIENWPKSDAGEKRKTLEDLLDFFSPPPLIPTSEDFGWLSSQSIFQEAAHVLVYGFTPNHFTFLLKDPAYELKGYTSMKDFAERLRSSGFKMKDKAEGEEESLLCQTSTIASPNSFKIYDEKTKQIANAAWPMSYIEFIRRGADPSSPTGRYEGFIPNQAQALFKMTAQK